MPNPPRPDLVRKAICAGVFNSANVEWTEEAYRRFQDDPDMAGFTPAGVKLLLREFVCTNGGALDVRNQGFEYWLKEDPDNPFWYRAVIPVPEFARGLFVELVISDYDEIDPYVWIVSEHEQKS